MPVQPKMKIAAILFFAATASAADQMSSATVSVGGLSAASATAADLKSEGYAGNRTVSLAYTPELREGAELKFQKQMADGTVVEETKKVLKETNMVDGTVEVTLNGDLQHNFAAVAEKMVCSFQVKHQFPFIGGCIVGLITLMLAVCCYMARKIPWKKWCCPCCVVPDDVYVPETVKVNVKTEHRLTPFCCARRNYALKEGSETYVEAPARFEQNESFMTVSPMLRKPEDEEAYQLKAQTGTHFATHYGQPPPLPPSELPKSMWRYS